MSIVSDHIVIGPFEITIYNTIVDGEAKPTGRLSLIIGEHKVSLAEAGGEDIAEVWERLFTLVVPLIRSTLGMEDVCRTYLGKKDYGWIHMGNGIFEDAAGTGEEYDFIEAYKICRIRELKDG